MEEHLTSLWYETRSPYCRRSLYVEVQRRLPRELRDMIYSYIIGQEKSLSIVITPCHMKKPCCCWYGCVEPLTWRKRAVPLCAHQPINNALWGSQDAKLLASSCIEMVLMYYRIGTIYVTPCHIDCPYKDKATPPGSSIHATSS